MHTTANLHPSCRRTARTHSSVATWATGAPVLVLVSCDPVAMARDIDLLGRHGYRHDGTEILDLFPHTRHLECVIDGRC